MNEAIIWEQVGGAEGFRRIVAAFYRRVQTDDLIGPMYTDDWEGAEKRLWQFLCFRFGGVPDYTEQRGHPRLRGRHMPFAIGVAERDRWMHLMEGAFAEAEIPQTAVLSLRAFFSQVADFMRNRPEKEALEIAISAPLPKES